jgi:hypothetical protein
MERDIIGSRKKEHEPVYEWGCRVIGLPNKFPKESRKCGWTSTGDFQMISPEFDLHKETLGDEGQYHHLTRKIIG